MDLLNFFVFELYYTREFMLKVFTLYNVCSVHRGMFSTSGGVQYIGGITMSTSGGYHEYIGGCSVHRRVP